MPFAIGNHKGRYPVTRTAPAHGTIRRYRRNCRCDLCRATYATYQHDARLRLKTYAANYFVSASLAREHLLKLRRDGVGKRAVEAVTGIQNYTLMRIANGTQRRIRQSTECKILAVTDGALSDGAQISAQLTIAQIRGLLARGYTLKALETQMGDRIQFLDQKLVTARTALRVQRLCDSLTGADSVARMMKLSARILFLKGQEERAA